MVNEFLKDGEAVVWVEHRYSDNDGAYSIAYIWTGKSIRQVNYANGHNDGSFRDAEVNATAEQLAASIEWYKAHAMDRNWCSYRQRATYIGCTVTLSRSRKAPNNTPLKVINFDKGGFNDRYGHGDPDRVCVELNDGDRVWVNASCIANVIEYCAPIWA